MTSRLTDHSIQAQKLDLALDAWSRRKWLALVVFASVASGAFTLARTLPNLYRAAATVLVERQQVSEAFVRPSVTAELETRLQTIREDVMSRARLTDLIVRLDLYPELRQKTPIDMIVARMRGDIQLELKSVESALSGRASTIAFTISYSGAHAYTVARVANELSRMYVDGNTKIREGQASRTAEFLKAQLADARRELDEHERRASEFRSSHLGELPQQVQTNLASLERLNMQLRLNGENQIRALDRRERLEQQRVGGGAVRPPQAASPESERLSKLTLQLDDLRLRFTDAYPDVVRLRQEIDTLSAGIARDPRPDERASAPTAQPAQSESILEVDSELRSLRKDERTLREAIAGYEQRVDNAPRRQQQFQELSRDDDTTKERYETLLKRYEEAQLAESLEQGQKAEQFRILDPALPPRDPVAPNRLQIVILGLALAFGLSVGVVLAAERLNSAFHTIDEVRALIAVPALGRVPLIQSSAETRRNRRRAVLAAVSALAALSFIVAASHHVAKNNEQLVRMMERGRAQ
jgi:polysaccharide chain length determinant protein (PEP-CTERM system associated)